MQRSSRSAVRRSPRVAAAVGSVVDGGHEPSFPGLRMPAGSNAVLIRRSSAIWSSPRRASRYGQLRGADPVLAGDRAAQVHRGPEDLVERLLGALAWRRVVLGRRRCRVQVAVAGVPEGGADDVVPVGDLVDRGHHRRRAAAGGRSRPPASSPAPAGPAPAGRSAGRRAAPPTRRRPAGHLDAPCAGAQPAPCGPGSPPPRRVAVVAEQQQRPGVAVQAQPRVLLDRVDTRRSRNSRVAGGYRRRGSGSPRAGVGEGVEVRHPGAARSPASAAAPR